MPSELAYFPFVYGEHSMRPIHHIGVAYVLTDLAAEIEADSRRWPLCYKTPPVARHSHVCVIKVMPTSDV